MSGKLLPWEALTTPAGILRAAMCAAAHSRGESAYESERRLVAEHDYRAPYSASDAPRVAIVSRWRQTPKTFAMMCESARMAGEPPPTEPLTGAQEHYAYAAPSKAHARAAAAKINEILDIAFAWDPASEIALAEAWAWDEPYPEP